MLLRCQLSDWLDDYIRESIKDVNIIDNFNWDVINIRNG